MAETIVNNTHLHTLPVARFKSAGQKWGTAGSEHSIAQKQVDPFSGVYTKTSGPTTTGFVHPNDWFNLRATRIIVFANAIVRFHQPMQIHMVFSLFGLERLVKFRGTVWQVPGYGWGGPGYGWGGPGYGKSGGGTIVQFLRICQRRFRSNPQGLTRTHCTAAG